MIEPASSVLTINKNIPVQLGLLTRGKQLIHDFCNQTWVVMLCRYLSPFRYQRENAEKILRVRNLILQNPITADSVSIVGGDSLKQLEGCIQEGVFLVRKEPQTQFSITLEDSVEAAFRLKKKSNGSGIAILNMANRWQMGGVYGNPFCQGSQEEALFRTSNLSSSLSSKEFHKTFQKMRASGGFTEKEPSHHIPYFGAVVSKDITFSSENQERLFTVISAAAPDMRKWSDEYASLSQGNCWEGVMTAKIQAIFEAAIRAGATKLVLGAFGCGCFANDPKKVASLFEKILNTTRYQGCFSEIVFAIKGSVDSPAYRAFQDVFVVQNQVSNQQTQKTQNSAEVAHPIPTINHGTFEDID